MSRPVRMLILSDLHLEFATFQPPGASVFDIAVLAGDICTGTARAASPRRTPPANTPSAVPGCSNVCRHRSTRPFTPPSS